MDAPIPSDSASSLVAPATAPPRTAAQRAAGSRRRAARSRTERRRRLQITELRLNPLQRAVFYLLVAIVHAVSLLPDALLYPLGVAGGLIAYWVDRRHVRIGERNLAIAFPERSAAERRRILRASYVNLGRSAAEYARLGGFFYKRLRDRISYDHFERWGEIQRRYHGKGGLVITAHFGNFELLTTAHALHGNPIALVHHTQRFIAGDALMTFVRERAGVRILRKHAAARAVLKALREGEIVGIPFDQNAKRSEAAFVPFFNELAATASGLARVVAMSGAPVVPVFMVRQPDNRNHVIEIHEELPIQRSDDAAADVLENTRRFVKVIEEVARRHPEQFLWTHRRYKTRPVSGAPPIYDD